MFECKKIWRVCGGDILFPHFPALPDTLFSRKTPKIPPFLGEIHPKPTINDTKVGVKYRFGHWIGDAIGGVVFAILGIMMVVIFNISVHGEKCGSTPLLYQAVRTAKLKAQRMGVAVDVDAITEDGQTRRVQYLPDGTLCKLWMQ